MKNFMQSYAHGSVKWLIVAILMGIAPLNVTAIRAATSENTPQNMVEPEKDSTPLSTDDKRNLEVTDPLWEVGLLGLGAYIPYYKGSSENRSIFFPLPYVVYRGEIIDLDDAGLTGHLFSSDRFSIDVSLYGEVNKNDTARDGMEELDTVMTGIGPALNCYFHRKEISGYDLYLSLPVRAAISGDYDDSLSADYRGIQSKLILFYENYDFLPQKKLEFIMGFSVGFMDSDLADYYYSENGEAADIDPSSYKARGGYAGATGSLDLTYHFADRFSVRLYSSVDVLDGAAFEDSPLVKETVNFTAGASLIFSIWQSERRVPRD